MMLAKSTSSRVEHVGVLETLCLGRCHRSFSRWTQSQRLTGTMKKLTTRDFRHFEHGAVQPGKALESGQQWKSGP